MAHVWSNRQLDPIELASLYEWFDLKLDYLLQ